MKNKHEIEIEIKGDDWSKALDEAFKIKVKNTKIDGFRKGSIPKNVYLKKFGLESLYMDAVDKAAAQAYTLALKEKALIPVVEPSIDIKEINNDHVIFKFIIITKPEVKVTKYTDLGVKKEKPTVSAEEIASEIKQMTNKYADIAVKEKGAVEAGNTVVIDFEGYVNGELLEGGSGKDFPLEIGSNAFIPGFEEGLIGLEAGATKELNLKFPENYTPELKNKAVKFKVTIKEIKERIIPQLNKEFYLDLGFNDITTEEQFKAEVKKLILERKNRESEDKYISDCLEAAAKNMKIEINEEIISEEVHRMIHQFEEQIKMQGLTIDQYLQFTNQKHEDLHHQMEPEAVKRIKYRYLLEYIAENEKFTITDSEANAEAEKMAEQYSMSKEEFLVNFGGLTTVKYDMKMHQAIEFLKKS